MIALLIIVVGIAALDVASLLGFTPDTRDPDYSLGRVIDRRVRADADAAEFIASDGPTSGPSPTAGNHSLKDVPSCRGDQNEPELLQDWLAIG
jgi:hypothetical protein